MITTDSIESESLKECEFFCEECDLGFATEKELNNHYEDHTEVVEVDIGNKIINFEKQAGGFLCYCGNVYTVSKFSAHLRRLCPSVQAIIKRERALEKPVQTDSYHKCDQCSESFKTKLALKKHSIVHVEKVTLIGKHLVDLYKKDGVFSCPCGKQDPSPAAFSSHMCWYVKGEEVVSDTETVDDGFE